MPTSANFDPTRGVEFTIHDEGGSFCVVKTYLGCPSGASRYFATRAQAESWLQHVDREIDAERPASGAAG